jgi:hypothetical protein
MRRVLPLFELYGLTDLVWWRDLFRSSGLPIPTFLSDLSSMHSVRRSSAKWVLECHLGRCKCSVSRVPLQRLQGLTFGACSTTAHICEGGSVIFQTKTNGGEFTQTYLVRPPVYAAHIEVQIAAWPQTAAQGSGRGNGSQSNYTSGATQQSSQSSQGNWYFDNSG